MATYEELPKFLQKDVKKLYEGGATPDFISKNLQHFGITKSNVVRWAKQNKWRKKKRLTDKEKLDILAYAFIDLDMDKLEKLRNRKPILNQFKVIPKSLIYRNTFTTLEVEEFLKTLKNRVLAKEDKAIKKEQKKIKDEIEKLENMLQKQNENYKEDSRIYSPAPKSEVKDRKKLNIKETDMLLDNSKDTKIGGSELIITDELDKILYMLIQALLGGVSIRSIRKNLKDKYNFSPKKISKLIETAKDRLVADLEKNAMFAIAFHREARLYLYRKMLDDNDFRGALEVLKDLGKLDGIYGGETPTHIELEKKDNTITLQVPEEYKEFI